MEGEADADHPRVTDSERTEFDRMSKPTNYESPVMVIKVK